jgi:hypothetical protein
MRKSKALSVAINREKKKAMGHGGTIPKTTANIIDNLPERFKNTSTGTFPPVHGLCGWGTVQTNVDIHV